MALAWKKNRLLRVPLFVHWFFPRRIWRGKNNGVYLTFDDGPHPEITPWLLDELNRFNCKVTFFWLGENIKKHPELFVRALTEGHCVGNHGFSHLSGKNISLETFKNNFEAGKTLVSSDLFRPPYGKLTLQQAKYTQERGKIVMWSFMPYDFDDTLDDKQIINLTLRNIKNKDIIVFHENDKTKEKIRTIIPEVIRHCSKKNFRFLTLEDLE